MHFETYATFARRDLPGLTGIASTRLGNWLDRLPIWQDLPTLKGAHAVYRLTHLFDLVGLAAMVDMGLPTAQAASITRNYGFYRSFLHGTDQIFRLVKREHGWQPHWTSDDIALITINTRAIAEQLLERIAALDFTPPYRTSFEAFIAGIEKHGLADTKRIMACIPAAA